MKQKVQGTGLGLRSSFLGELNESGFLPDWFEITPENWIGMPAIYRNSFEKIAESFPLAAHGVSLSLGSPEPPDRRFLVELKSFLDHYGIELYSEHLSFSSLHGNQTYELLPVPMTVKVADFMAEKIKRVSDALKRPLIVENTSWYFMPYAEMTEAEFINRILEKSGASLLLDVNNIFVNSVNHGFDPFDFLESLNPREVAWIHVAGHTRFPGDHLIVDTHGDAVRREVLDLLRKALRKWQVPVLLERDNNVPPLQELMVEYEIIRKTVQDELKTSGMKSA